MNRKSRLLKTLNICIMVAMILGGVMPAAPSLARVQAQAEPVRGDITGDGVVDGRDALKIMRIVEGLDSPTPEEIARGDVHPLPGTEGRLVGDGQLTREDAEKILRGEVGLIPEGEVTGDFSGSPPRIDDFNPAYGPIGTQVTIYGENFVAASPEENLVVFGDVPASVLSSTGTQLVAEVPAGAETGRLRVITPAGEVVSPFDFTVTVERAGVLVPPAGISPSDYGLINKFGEVVEVGADGAFSSNVDVQGVTTQFAVPLDDSDRILLSVDVGTGWGAQGEAAFQGEAGLDLLSTAQALVFLSPHFITSMPENAQVHMAYIRDDPKVAELAQVLEQLYPATPHPFDDPQFEEAYNAAIESVMERLPENFTLPLGQVSALSPQTTYRVFQVLGTEGGGRPQVVELTANLNEDDGGMDWYEWLASRRVYYPDRKETIAGDSTQIGGIPPESVPGNPVDWLVNMAQVKDIYDTFPEGIGDIILADPLRVLLRTGDHHFGVIDAKSYATYIDLFGTVYEEYFWKPATEMVTDAMPDLEGKASPDGDLHVVIDDQGEPVDAVYVVRAYSGQFPILGGSELAESDFATVALQDAGYYGYWFNVSALGWNVVMAAIDIASMWIDPASACSIHGALTGSHGRKARLVLRRFLRIGGKKGMKVALKRAPKAGMRVSTGEGWKTFWSVIYDIGKDFTTVLAGDCLGGSGKLLARKAAAATGIVGKFLEFLYRLSLGAQAADRIAALLGLNALSNVTPLETWIVVIGQPFTPTVEKVLPEEAAPEEEVMLEGKSFDYRAAQNNEVRLGDAWETARQVEVLQVNPDGKTLRLRVPDDQPEGQVDIWIKTSYTFHGLPVKQDTPLRVKRIPKLRELSPDFGFAPVPANAERPFAGYAGSEVILKGTGLKPTAGAPADKVFFGTTQAQVLMVSTTEVKVRVPDVPPGQTEVYIDSPEHGVQTQHLPFTVLDKPQLTSVSPASAKVGQVLTLRGANFRDNLTDVVVSGAGGSGFAPLLDVQPDTMFVQMPTVGEPGDHLTIQVWNPAGSSGARAITRDAGLQVPDPVTPPAEQEFPPGYGIWVNETHSGHKLSFDDANAFINGTDPFAPPYDDLDAVYEWTWNEKIITGTCQYLDEPDAKSGPFYSYHKNGYDYDFDGEKGHPGPEAEIIMRINVLEPQCHDGQGGRTDPVLYIKGSQDNAEGQLGEEVDCEEKYVVDDCPEEGDFIGYLSSDPEKQNGGKGYADLIQFDPAVDSFQGESFTPDDGDTLEGRENLILSGSIIVQNANQVQADGIERVAGIVIVGDGKTKGALNHISAETVGGGGIRLTKAIVNQIDISGASDGGVTIKQGGSNEVRIYDGTVGNSVRIVGSSYNLVGTGGIESPEGYGVYIEGGGHNGYTGGVRSSGGTAVYFKETVDSWAGAEVENPGGRGFEIEGGGLNSIGGSVEGGGDGVRITNSSENTVDVTVNDCGGYGIALIDSWSHTVYGGAKGCAGSGLYIQGGGNHEIARFDAEANGGHGIELNNTLHNTLSHTTLVGNHGNGLYLRNGTRFTGFTSFGGDENEGNWNNQNGIVIDGPTTYHNMVGNAGVRFRFYEDDEYIGNHQNGIVIQNGAHGNGVYGAYGNGQNGVVVRGGAHDNTIYAGIKSNGQHGVLIEDAHDNTITQWHISSAFQAIGSNGGDGIHIGPDAPDNSVVDDLLIYGNGGNGVTVEGSGTLIQGAWGMEIGKTSKYTPQANRGYGIFVDGALGTEIHNIDAGRNEQGGIWVQNVQQDVATAGQTEPLTKMNHILVGYERVEDDNGNSLWHGIDGLPGYGIYFDESSDVSFYNVSIHGHQMGLHVGGASPARFTLVYSHVESSATDGVELLNLQDSLVNLYASKNGENGISLVNGSNVRFIGEAPAVSDYSLNGNRNGHSGISIENSQHVSIGYARFYRNQQHGITIGPESRYINLRGVSAYDNQGSGVYINQASDVSILSAGGETSGFRNNNEAGITLENVENVNILAAPEDANYINHNNGAGIDVHGQDSDGIVIAGWDIHENKEAGIRVEDATNVLIGGFSSDEGNSIDLNKTGIVASGPDTRVVIANNHIWRNQHLALPGGADWRQPESVHGMNPAEATAEMAGVGVALYNDISGATIQGNQIDANQTQGILLAEGAQANVIKGNTITGNGGAGIRVEGPNTVFNTITMNSITNNQGKGIELVNGGNAEIEAPVIEQLAWRSYNIAGSAIGAPAGSRVEVYTDTADEGERLVGVSTVYGERFYVRADPSAGFTPNMLAGLQLHAIVIHPSGNTSEFGPAELKSQRNTMVFTSTRDGNQEIYLLYPWQDQPSRLTDHAAADHSPRLSPDADRVLFVSERSGNPDIWMLGADLSNPTRLTQDVSAEYDPAWSPDGSQMAFVSEREGNPEIYTLGLGPAGPAGELAYDDGVAEFGLGAANGDAYGVHFTQQPTAQVADASAKPLTAIRFWINADPAEFQWQIYDWVNGQPGPLIAEGQTTPETTGWHTVELTGVEVGEDFLVGMRYTEDDQPKLGFDVREEASDRSWLDTGEGWWRLPAPDFIMIRADFAAGAVQVTDDAFANRHPAWSPDGTKIAFTSDRSGSLDIWVMNADGTGLQQLTSSPAADYKPAWSPDGAQIAFASERDGNAEIYLMSAGGGNPTRLTDHPATDTDPTWNPDGGRILFSSDRGSGMEIYAVRPDGSGVRRLTISLGDNTQPDTGRGAREPGSRGAWVRGSKEDKGTGGQGDKGTFGLQTLGYPESGPFAPSPLHLRTSAPLPNQGASVQVTIQSASALPGETFTVPVTLAGAESLGYLAFDIVYDPIRLTLLEATPGEFATGGLFVLNPELYPSDSGRIRFSWISVAGFSGDGTVLNLTFQVETDAEPGDIPVSFQNPGAGDVALGDTPVASQDGQVTITCAGDVATTFVTAEPGGSVNLVARVTNTGDGQLLAGLPVAFYLGDPDIDGELIGTAATTRALNPGESEEVTVTWDADTPGDHDIYIVANDDGAGSSPLALCSTPAPVQQTVSILDVPLVEGWNLMSAYINPFTTDIEVVQRPIAGTYVVIQGFDGGAQSYYPDLSPAVNTLKEVDGEHGYWIKMASNQLSVNSDQSAASSDQSANAVATLRVVGEKFAEDRPLGLDAGWNLVSYLPRQGLPVADALQSIDGQYFAVLGFDQGALSYYPDLDPSFNTLTTLEPLRGYWVKMNQAGTLQYPTTTRGKSGEIRGNQRAASAGKFPPSSAQFLRVPLSSTWVNFYGPARLPDGTPLPEGATVLAIDSDGVVCGAAPVRKAGQYGLLACYGDDPTTPADEGAQAGDLIQLVVDGQVLGTGTWTAHGGRQWVPLGPAPVWRVWLPVVSR